MDPTKVTTAPAGSHAAVTAQQQPAMEPQPSPSLAVMDNDGSPAHGDAWPFSSPAQAEQNQLDQQHAQSISLPDVRQAHALGSNEDAKDITLPVKSRTPGAHQGFTRVGTVSDGAAVCADSIVNTAQVCEQQQSPDEHFHVKSAHTSSVNHSADEISRHDHRSLAEGQESHGHAAKVAHRSKLSAQMCQGKSHQRLLLMTALHVSAHKQMKRQHKHAHAGRTRRQQSI